jgi:hypothetical protein
MGSITRSVRVKTAAPEVWEAMRDYGAVDTRVAPGFVVDSKLDGADRVVKFSSGAVARERLVSLDDNRRRLVYKVVEGGLPLEHHQGIVEVLENRTDQTGCQIVWVTDFLPEHLGPVLEGLMDEGAAAMVRAFAG